MSFLAYYCTRHSMWTRLTLVLRPFLFFFYIFKAIFHLLRFGHWDIGFVTEYLNLETHITSTSISLFRILLLMQCSIHKYIVRKQILTTFDKNWKLAIDEKPSVTCFMPLKYCSFHLQKKTRLMTYFIRKWP